MKLIEPRKRLLEILLFLKDHHVQISADVGDLEETVVSAPAGAGFATLVELLARRAQVEITADQAFISCADNVLAGLTIVAGGTVLN